MHCHRCWEAGHNKSNCTKPSRPKPDNFYTEQQPSNTDNFAEQQPVQEEMPQFVQDPVLPKNMQKKSNAEGSTSNKGKGKDDSTSTKGKGKAGTTNTKGKGKAGSINIDEPIVSPEVTAKLDSEKCMFCILNCLIIKGTCFNDGYRSFEGNFES